jgi:DNA-directed RNA polymerase subunit RPC12/RpoP
MGNKKKRGHPDVEEILARPWCYYCERDFDDLKILINHQKARHFKCERCGRRLNTAGGKSRSRGLRFAITTNRVKGLSVHMTQVHKETLTTIENALPNRSGLDVEIFGMEGIPEDIVTSHNQRILQQFAQAEADRRAATGNHGPGNAGPGAAKKPKFESPSELKKRLAEHKAKKAAEQAAGISSGDETPIGGHGSQSPGVSQSPGAFVG